jgi:hypothetical protein
MAGWLVRRARVADVALWLALAALAGWLGYLTWMAPCTGGAGEDDTVLPAADPVMALAAEDVEGEAFKLSTAALDDILAGTPFIVDNAGAPVHLVLPAAADLDVGTWLAIHNRTTLNATSLYAPDAATPLAISLSDAAALCWVTDELEWDCTPKDAPPPP